MQGAKNEGCAWRPMTATVTKTVRRLPAEPRPERVAAVVDTREQIPTRDRLTELGSSRTDSLGTNATQKGHNGPDGPSAIKPLWNNRLRHLKPPPHRRSQIVPSLLAIDSLVEQLCRKGCGRGYLNVVGRLSSSAPTFACIPTQNRVLFRRSHLDGPKVDLGATWAISLARTLSGLHRRHFRG
jgi:hypothetical protein